MRTSLLLHLISSFIAILLALALLALRNINRVQIDIMVRADIRITNHIQLERMGALGERKLQFHVQALRYRDAFYREQLARALLADDYPPVHHLLGGEVRRHDENVALVFVLVRVAAE